MLNLDSVKKVAAIAVYVLGAILILMTLFDGGQGMEMRLIPERSHISETQDLISVSVELRHPGAGRMKINDILLTMKEGTNGNTPIMEVRDRNRLLEHEVSSERISSSMSDLNIVLKKGDASQFAYWFTVTRGIPAMIDATVLAHQVGILGIFNREHPLTASCIVHPM